MIKGTLRAWNELGKTFQTIVKLSIIIQMTFIVDGIFYK